MASAPITPILYFGCLKDSGHYLWSKASGYCAQVPFHEIKTMTPWGLSIDDGVFPSSPLRRRAGAVHHAQKDGWTLVYWADYSVDSRPGSHSTFVVPALLTKAELIEGARHLWPEVFHRPRFPVLT